MLSIDKTVRQVGIHLMLQILQNFRAFQREYIAKKAISVVAPVESLSEAVDHPVGAAETVSFGGCCCRGKLSADVQLPKSTYAPGDQVIGSIKIDNRHPRHVVDMVRISSTTSWLVFVHSLLSTII